MKIFVVLLILITNFAIGQSNFELEKLRSKLTWIGKPIVGGGHQGTIQFISGSLSTMPDGTISKGDFAMDMKSIKNTDVKPEKSAKDLENHLKSDDFFSVDRFPTANFAITKMNPNPNSQSKTQFEVSGFLSLKGITNLITFPATITYEKETIRVIAEITIDRTKWDIIYDSKSIFGSLKDNAISDEIKVLLNLFFEKKI
jgi:polyisoprenoid-binding protein YceI